LRAIVIVTAHEHGAAGGSGDRRFAPVSGFGFELQATGLSTADGNRRDGCWPERTRGSVASGSDVAVDEHHILPSGPCLRAASCWWTITSARPPRNKRR
jgi:hypothetical protein